MRCQNGVNVHGANLHYLCLTAKLCLPLWVSMGSDLSVRWTCSGWDDNKCWYDCGMHVLFCECCALCLHWFVAHVIVSRA